MLVVADGEPQHVYGGVSISQRLGDRREMPDVPKFDFVLAMAEIWFQINFAACHMAYVRVYSQSEALRTQTQPCRLYQDHDPDGLARVAHALDDL
jgi:hypothetical protein